MRLRNSFGHFAPDTDSPEEAAQFALDCIREGVASGDNLPGPAFRDMDSGKWYALRLSATLEKADPDPDLAAGFEHTFGDLKDEDEED